MQPVPAVYGMTIAEYAFMIAGEKWLSEKPTRNMIITAPQTILLILHFISRSSNARIIHTTVNMFYL
jgi:hypothetical protein